MCYVPMQLTCGTVRGDLDKEPHGLMVRHINTSLEVNNKTFNNGDHSARLREQALLSSPRKSIEEMSYEPKTLDH